MTRAIIKKLEFHPYSQCHVEISPEMTVFFSYHTAVLFLDNEGWLECTGTYSQTTRKQIGWFLREYAPDISYSSVKQCYQDDMRINIHTGEIESLI